MVRRIYEEARGHIESRLAANDAALKDLDVGSIDFPLSGTLVNAQFDSHRDPLRLEDSVSLLQIRKRQ